jgi:hypothetical protein
MATSSKKPLTAAEAEAIVEHRIQEFGLGALPQMTIAEREGRWHICWEGRKRVTSPMSEAEWLEWLETYVGEVSPERLGSNEG